MGGQLTAATTRSETFERQVLENMDALYSTALKLTRNPVDAQDLLQDALVRALRFHYRFTEGTYIRAWLLTILRNTFINDYRKRARRPILVEWTGTETPCSPTGYDEFGYYPKELHARDALELLDDDIRHAVDSLPEGHRQTVILADIHELSYKEIAVEMNCPLGTVMSRLHRGRRLLRDSLRQYRPQMAFS